MSYTLKDQIIQLLNELDLSTASNKAKFEIRIAIVTFQKHPNSLDFSEENTLKAAHYIEYIFDRFPELQTDNNLSVINKISLSPDSNNKTTNSPLNIRPFDNK